VCGIFVDVQLAPINAADAYVSVSRLVDTPIFLRSTSGTYSAIPVVLL
jgi:hypothetical protein